VPWIFAPTHGGNFRGLRRCAAAARSLGIEFTGTLAWIGDAQEPVNSEFRDERFSAAFQRKSGDPAVFTVAYVVRAVSPGRYVHPQAYVEDMYRPDRFGRTATGTIEVTAAK
jgi:uncharacterized protein YfaS (alpha-2-macroglobulin family)